MVPGVDMTFLTNADLAARWGMREGTLRMWRYRGYGPRSSKIGATTVYLLHDVETWERDHMPEVSSA